VAVDENEEYYVYREYAEPDLIISQASANILSHKDYDEDGVPIDIYMTLAPADLWGSTQETGRDKADIWYESGITLIKSNNNREAGWLCIKEALGKERLHIFNTCTELIACLTALQRDGRNPNDCMTQPHEITHLPDALRYFCAYWISLSAAPKREKTYEERLSEYKNKKLNPKKLRKGSYY